MRKLEHEFLQEFHNLRGFLDKELGCNKSSMIFSNYDELRSVEHKAIMMKLKSYRNVIVHQTDYLQESDECIQEWIKFLKEQIEFCKNNIELIKSKI